MTATDIEIPGYVAGTWTIDPVHSYVGFLIKHMMVSKVRGRFSAVHGTSPPRTSPWTPRSASPSR